MTLSKYISFTGLSIALILNSTAFAQTPRSLAPLAQQPASRADVSRQGEASKIIFGQPTAIPNGYYEMCRHRPAVCRVRGGRLALTPDGSVKFNHALMDQLVSVNLDVNDTIRPVYRDGWMPGRTTGDCKDYALTKRQRLIDSGWPSSALLVAIVHTFMGEQHLILVARTNEGDFILDNLTKEIVSWTQARYIWEKIQSTTDAWVWNTI